MPYRGYGPDPEAIALMVAFVLTTILGINAGILGAGSSMSYNDDILQSYAFGSLVMFVFALLVLIAQGNPRHIVILLFIQLVATICSIIAAIIVLGAGCSTFCIIQFILIAALTPLLRKKCREVVELQKPEEDARSIEASFNFKSSERFVGRKLEQKTIGGRSLDGRFIFILKQVGFDYKKQSTIEIEMIDVLFGSKTVIKCNEDFFGAGDAFNLYELSSGVLVMISITFDHDNQPEVIKQWLLRIDRKANMAQCFLYRNYAVPVSGSFQARSTKEETFILVPCADGVVLPSDPLDPRPAEDMSPWIQQASAAHSLLAHCFIIAPTAIGFFRYADVNSPGSLDLMHVVVLDVTTGGTYVQDVEVNAPLSNSDGQLFEMQQASDHEIVILATCDGVLKMLLLDSRRLQYTEIKGFGRAGVIELFICLPDCIVLADEKETVVEEKCMFTGHIYSEERYYTQRYRLIRHPKKAHSLVRLAAVAALKKSSPQERALLAARVG